MDKSSQDQKAVTAFLDTMIFIHFKSFDEVDWRNLLKANKVTLIILPVIVGELDKHKDTHVNQKIRKRAKSISKKFHHLFENELEVTLRDDVVIKYEVIEPQLDFQANSLNAYRQDDYQLASIIQYKSDHPGEDVVLVTQDFNFKIKAKTHGIDTKSMPSELELPDELDPQEKIIKELQQELLELKKQFPSLKVRFSDGSDRATFTLIKVAELSEEKIAQRIAQIKRKYPKMEVSQENPSQLPDESQAKQKSGLRALLEMFSEFDSYSDEDKREYNDALDKFYSRYEGYLNHHSKHLQLESRMVSLDIVLLNEGTAPAEDVDIYLHFPDGFELSDEFSDPPHEPKPPKRPLTMTQKIGQRPAWRMPMTPYIPGPNVSRSNNNPPPPNVSGPNIRRTKSYDVHFKVRRIKHNSPISFRQLCLTFVSVETATSFGIEYRINAGNMPREAKGFINVIIEKQYEPPHQPV